MVDRMGEIQKRGKVFSMETIRRMEENVDDFWEAEYMAAMDETETEENIKKLAADLWKQWKEYELDE